MLVDVEQKRGRREVPRPARNGTRPVRRVLMTADAVGGVWPYAMDLASGLRQRGVAVTVAVMGPAPREDQRADAVGRGIDVVHEPFALEWMPGGQEDFAASAAWLLALADRLSVDLVHLNGFSHAALDWRVPVMVVVHSCVRTWWRAVHGEAAPASWDTYSSRVAAGLGAANLVVAPTHALLADVSREYGAVARCCVIPNGSSSVGDAAPEGGKEPLVLSAGRVWDEAKNIAAVCAVAPQLSWPTYVAGDAPADPLCFAAGGAHYLGRLSAAEVRIWYRRAAIYALPARYEPFGLSVLEAAAAGCALVLGDIQTLRENWSGAAVFVPPDDHPAISASLEALIRDDQRRNELGRAARMQSARFGTDRMVDGYLAAYASTRAAVVAV